FILSLATLAVGAILYFFNRPANRKLSFLARFDALAPQTILRKLWVIGIHISTWYTDLMHNGFLRSYLLKIIIFAELLLAYELFMAGPLYIDYSILSPISFYEAMNVLVLIAALFLVVKTPSRLTAVVGTSVVGYAIC